MIKLRFVDILCVARFGQQPTAVRLRPTLAVQTSTALQRDVLVLGNPVALH